jgi:hypothetical protein
VIGGAAVGGAVAATQILGGDGGGDDVTHYSGPFSGNSTAVAANGICSVTSMHVGTVSLDIKIGSDGAVTGTGEVNQTRTVAQSSCGAFPVGSSQSDGCCQPSPAVSGTTASLSFSGSHPGGAGTVWQYDFSGSLNSGVVTGTFVLNVAGDPAFQPVRAVFPVVLQ